LIVIFLNLCLYTTVCFYYAVLQYTRCNHQTCLVCIVLVYMPSKLII
jgi:hypothetical protein